MNKTAFKKLFLVTDDLKRNFRSESISPEDRVVITSQYLSQGINNADFRADIQKIVQESWEFYGNVCLQFIENIQRNLKNDRK